MPKTSTKATTETPLIEVRGLHRYFGEKHVLRGADLDIYHGETLCMLGTSGGGKSVMVKHMLGLMQPDEGSVKIDGVDISNMGERELGPIRKKLGIMFQNGALFDSMTWHRTSPSLYWRAG